MTRWAWILALGSLAHAADVVELARSAPPEFFADTILQLVEAGKIADRQVQVQLLEDAFAAAAGAQQPIRLVAIFGTPALSSAGYRSKAGELRLDALSLQSRMLKAMLALDPARAREWFGRVPRPASGPRPCEDPLVPDTSGYYEIAGALAQSSFTAAEKTKSVHVQFLQGVLAGAESPGELADFARAIQSVELKPAEWELLLAAVATKLETIREDYRPFALSIGGLRADVEHLSDRARAAGLKTDFLALAFRTYLVAQLRAPRCNEDFEEPKQAVEWFNSGFRGQLPAIAEAEANPSQRKGALQAESYFESDDSKDLGAALTGLQFGPDGKPRSQADRSTGEWRTQLAQFLRDLAAWQPSGSAVDVLHQRTYVLRAVLELTPPGEDRDRIISLCVGLLQSSSAEKQSPAEWLWQVKSLLAASGQAPKMIQAFRDSGDVGLALYAER